jgi:hypothetical protein
MLYRAIAFSLGGAGVAGPGAVVCADAKATVPFIDFTRGLAHDEPVHGGMTMKLMPLLMASLVAAGCASVEPFDAPYALVEVGPISATRKELPLIVNAIDGDYLLNPRSGPIKPGKHQLEVQFSTRDGPYWKRKKMVELDAKPCTRYRIVAQYTNLTNVDWTPVIYPEPIGECVAKFQAGG